MSRQPSRSAPERNAKLAIKIYNLANVPRDTLGTAERTTGWIFRQAGIELDWADCPVANQDAAALPDCANVTDSLALSIRLLPKALSERFELPSSKFGFALHPSLVFVFFDRVQEVTEDTGFSRPNVLGHIMAHELGHLLLGGEAHSATGIMGKNLFSKDCDRPGEMRLVFTREQAERMRRQLRQAILVK